jgi:hypothetical protein
MQLKPTKGKRFRLVKTLLTQGGIRHLYTSVIIFSVCVFPLVAVTHFLAFPDTPVYMTSLIVITSRKKDVLFYLSYSGEAVLWWLVSSWVVSHVVFIATFFANFSISICPIINCELRSNRKSYGTIDQLRNVNSLVKFYRGVEYIVKLYNESSQPTVLPLNFAVTQFSLYCTYTLITGWNSIDQTMKLVLILALFSAVAPWTAFLRFGGWFLMNSKETLRSWKHFKILCNEDSKYLSKFKKSCRPLAMRAEEDYGQYMVKRLSLLKFLHRIIKQTLSALLTFK